MDYSVDWAKPEDIDNIMTVEDACFDAGIREQRDVFWDRLCSARYCSTVLRRRETGCIYGYFCSEIRKSMMSPTVSSYALGRSAKKTHDPNGTVLYISSFAVHPDAPRAGKGLGRFLFQMSVDKILKAHPKIDRMALIVNEGWMPARRIYETEGFGYTGRIPCFFREADGTARTALVMEKKVGGEKEKRRVQMEKSTRKEEEEKNTGEKNIRKEESTKIKKMEIRLVAGACRIDDLKTFLKQIQEITVETGVSVQGFSAEKIGGRRHILYAVRRALDAFERGENEAKDRGLEIMRFASGQRQIEKSFAMGLREGNGKGVFVLTGNGGAKMESASKAIARLIEEEDFDDAVKPAENHRLLMEQFSITEEEIDAVFCGDHEKNGGGPEDDLLFEDLIIERVALVGHIR